VVISRSSGRGFVETPAPQRDRGRHGLLHVRVAGQRYVALSFRQFRHGLTQGIDPRDEIVGRFQQVKAQCR
jgi:hypothetical protein